jgi:hypothetical protein
VGTGPGQITQAEADQITAGDVMEIIETLPLEGGGATTASLNATFKSVVDDWKDRQVAELRRYGQVVA